MVGAKMNGTWLVVFVIMTATFMSAVFSCGGDDDDDDQGDDDDDDSVDDDEMDTWTDSSSDLTWQVPPSGEPMSWDDAIAYCEELILSGADDWRLPTISELRTLIRGCVGTFTGGSCGVTDSCLDSSCLDDSCSSCVSYEGPNGGCYGPSELPGECDYFWSSSPVEDDDGFAWMVHFVEGSVNNQYADIPYYARCVRG